MYQFPSQSQKMDSKYAKYSPSPLNIDREWIRLLYFYRERVKYFPWSQYIHRKRTCHSNYLSGLLNINHKRVKYLLIASSTKYAFEVREISWKFEISFYGHF